MHPPTPTIENETGSREACPLCGRAEHLSLQSVGSLTSDMPDRPYRVICTHIDHDTVVGPTAYGRLAAETAWNTRPTQERRKALALWDDAKYAFGIENAEPYDGE